MLEDLRYGARMLLKQPGFTLVAVLSLAVGIGATTTVFSLANAVLFRPLPVRDASTLVTINKPEPDETRMHVISYPAYLDYREKLSVFSDIVAWTEADASIELGGQAEKTYAMLVSGNYFPTLGVQPALGRLLIPADDGVPGESAVAMLSYAFWQGHFAGDSSVVGRTVELNGQPFTIVGVAPKGFTSTYNVFAPTLYAPLAMKEQILSRPGSMRDRGSSNLKLSARLAPGVTSEQAQAALTVLDKQLEMAWPEKGETSKKPTTGLEVAPIGSYPGETQWALYGIAGLLVAIVGSVLLIACANVAGMLLARASVRRREMALRLAVGASRGRLIRQLLTESSLLFLAAGSLGIVLTMWLTSLVNAIPVPMALPFVLEATTDWRVLGFTLTLALITGLVFGLAPALEAARTDLNSGLKGSQSAGLFKRSRVRHAFVVAQISLSLFLLVGAGLFARALQYGNTVYPGRSPETVLTASLDPRAVGYDVPRSRDFYARLTERVAALPGVDAVSMARGLWVGIGYANTEFYVDGAQGPVEPTIESNAVAPRFFETVGVRLVSGRDFAPADREGAPEVVIINEAAARRYWPGDNALGKRMKVGSKHWAEVIGVAEDGRFRIAGQAPKPFAYKPFLQSRSDDPGMTFLLRFRGDKATLLNAVRRETRALDPRMPLQSPMTLEGAVELATLPWKAAGVVATVFGLIGLGLAALGIYGLVSYTVSQRTREIGVRVALGAQANDIRTLVVGGGMKLALIGLVIGITLSLASTRALGALLFGISAADPLTYVGTSMVLGLVTLAASYLPARRATRTDPLVALRQE